ncbi:hypothetical protein [uncultured Sphingobium sp.]|jgi:hypothetical protein|uniref:hypothetical protein n=1 Tax=uncultured Sphingobium sp. TaxID=316087 RepID=UPI0032B2E21C|tara:strand:+ start:16483 stop:16983 length:501 start_codon:yes stop_codon:yes gene_type:complete
MLIHTVVSTEFSVRTSALRVWSALTYFKAYTHWHPTYEFSSNPSKLREEASVVWNALGRFRFSTSARITRFEKPKFLSWEFDGIAFLTIAEHYSIKNCGDSVRIRHVIQYRGVMGRLVGLLLRRGLLNSQRSQDRALVEFLNRSAAAKPEKPGKRFDGKGSRRCKP